MKQQTEKLSKWNPLVVGGITSALVVAGIATAANVGSVADPMPTAVAGAVIKAVDVNDLASSITTLDARSFQKDATETRFNLPNLSTGDARPADTEVYIWDDGTLESTYLQSTVFPTVADLPVSGVQAGVQVYVAEAGMYTFNGTNWWTADKAIECPTGTIADAKFGDGQHDFCYAEVTAADGTKWLNNVLGAEYNNIHSPHFNPTQQGQSEDDFRAYGSLFQWGRPADGHELRNCTDSTTCASVSSSTDVLATTTEVNHSSFIKAPTAPKDWTTTDSDGSLRSAFLAKSDGTGICPVGFRLPTETELEATRVAENITNKESYLSSTFKGVLSGNRDYSTGSLNNLDASENLSSSSASSTYFRGLYVNLSGQSWASLNRAHGFSARCLSD